MAVRLLLTGSVEEQWRDVVWPWLDGRKPWLVSRPTVVLTPDRAQGFYLRSRLVRMKAPALGLRFWTPSDARKFLLDQSREGVRAITQADLRLLTRQIAERLLQEERTEDRTSLASVVQDPGPFLRAYDLLGGAGWNPVIDGAEYGRALAAELGRELKRCRVATQAGIHRRLREERRAGPALPLAQVLMLGFNASHWPLWDLLQAVCSAADETLVALDQPKKFGETVDQLWIGSWESFSGNGYEIPESESEIETGSSLRPLASSYEEGTLVNASTADIHFLATSEVGTQVRAIVLQAMEYLKNPECTRLGIAFPEANALALGAAEQLRELGVPLNDGPGAFQLGLFETPPWQSWLELQEGPSVGSLLHWLRACETAGIPCGLASVPAHVAAELLERALGQSLMDDLGFLALQMEKESGDNKVVADFLRQRISLPVEGTWEGFLALVRKAMLGLKWKSFLDELPESTPSWLPGSAPVSRSSFLGWLREITDSRERVRRGGNHFYGKVHLLLYGQLAGQGWSHLILTGLNEGVFPRLFESGAFGSRHELAELNQKARALNRRGLTQGAQGEGHETVASGHGHCLLPLERYELSLRDLCTGLEATSHAVCLAAVTQSGGRKLLPSDFFNHAWQVKTGRVLDDVTFLRLAQKTAERCREHAGLFPPGTPFSVRRQDITATSRAHAARRDPLQPFGAYEFAYAAPPPSPVQLACKRWETALAHPSSVWLDQVIGVGPWPKGELKWPLAIGTWVHRWLMQALRDSTPDNFIERLRENADLDLVAVRRRAQAVGIEPYSWWIHVWGQARAITLGLGRMLAPELTGKKVLSEVSLPNDLAVALPGCEVGDFALHGKIDLLLVEPAAADLDPRRLDLSGCSCWVIDFKTGSAKKMNARLIGEGNAIQIVLYGLAVRALGAATTSMSLHTHDAALGRQVSVEALLPLTGVFHSLDTIHRRGIFGQSPAGTSDHAFQPDLPMTTRPVSPEILAAKWALVHEIPPPAGEETP